MYHLKPICLLYNPPDSHISSERHHHAASFVSNCMSCHLVKPAQAQCVHCTSGQEHFRAPCVTQETWSLEESRFPAKYISALCGIFCIVILTVSAQPDPRGRVGAVEKSAGFKSFSAQLTSGCRQALNQSCTPVTTTSVKVQTMSFTSMASLLLKGGHLHNFPAFHQTVHKCPSRGAASQANLLLQPKCDRYSSKFSAFHQSRFAEFVLLVSR